MEPTNADIKEDTKVLVEEVHGNPSNTELLLAVHEQGDNLREHAIQDFQVAKDQAQVNKETKESFDAIHERLNQLPTKADFGEMMRTIKSISIGVKFFRFTFDNAGQIGAFLLLLTGIFFFFKYGILAVIAKFIP